MSKFTPGPWEIGDENNASCEVCPRDVDITISMSRYDRFSDKFLIERDEMLANAHLIAAAPDMYEALDTLVAVVGLTAFKHEGQRQVLQEAVDLSVAALKKARGEI